MFTIRTNALNDQTKKISILQYKKKTDAKKTVYDNGQKLCIIALKN